jgi:nitrite reductase (NADH) small subunit/3-phenylpropionate/trans-cinnamate dioxygenase ferredoxin subunit
MAWISLCNTTDVPQGSGKYVEIDGFQLAVFMDDGKPYVMENTCPHAGAPMARGYVEDGCAVCAFHGWSFRLDTGEMRNSPNIKLGTYPVRILNREGQPPLIQADLPMA